jgi:hypothetical protein
LDSYELQPEPDPDHATSLNAPVLVSCENAVPPTAKTFGDDEGQIFCPYPLSPDPAKNATSRCTKLVHLSAG